jgi:hypothetical protein
MARARAWLLNFDAEDELASGARHTSSRAVVARFAALAQRVGPLLGPGDVVIDAASPARLEAHAFAGRAWCPTPGARRVLALAGVTLPEAPALAVLRRVNHRRFCAELGQMLPGARYVDTVDDVVDLVNTPSPAGPWLLKRPFGFAGRGRKRLRPGPLDAADRAWIEASIAPGEGLQIEPWVELAGDFGLHGFLAASGALTLGAPTAQRTDATGAWLSTSLAAPGDLAADEERALVDAAELTASALHAAGYFGPFGVDAFRWIDPTGARRWNPRGEINARYSMGWAVGMGAKRPDLEG